MPGSPTPICSFTVPTDGGDSGIWGAETNTNWPIADKLGALAQFDVSSNYIAVISTAAETYIRVTTGSSTITVTLPAPTSAIKGKVYTVAKVDSGTGQVSVVPASGTINGAAN
jgi:hypothetical protein